MTTNRPTTIASACRIIGLELMDHLRIRTMIISGEPMRARDLLNDRMRSMLNSYAEEGTALGPDEFIASLSLLNSSFGPQVVIEMRKVSLDLIDEWNATIANL